MILPKHLLQSPIPKWRRFHILRHLRPEGTSQSVKMNKMSSCCNVAVMFRTYCVSVRLPKHGFVTRSEEGLRNTFSDRFSESSARKALWSRHSHFLFKKSSDDWQGGLLGQGIRLASFLRYRLVSAYARTSGIRGRFYRRPEPGSVRRSGGMTELESSMFTTQGMLSFCS